MMYNFVILFLIFYEFSLFYGFSNFHKTLKNNELQLKNSMIEILRTVFFLKEPIILSMIFQILT